jgi:hypothetical protein
MCMGHKHKTHTTRRCYAPPGHRVAPPAIPSALTALAADLALDADTTAMLARITVAGAQPATRDGWLLIWMAIRHACTPLKGGHGHGPGPGIAFPRLVAVDTTAAL